MSSGFSVLLERAASVQEIAAMIAQAKKIPLFDAAQQARGRWNIIGEGLEAGEAEQFAASAKEKGFAPIVVADEQLIEPPSPRPVTIMALGQQGFTVKIQDGRTGDFQWSDVGLMGVAAWKETTVTTGTRVDGPSATEKMVRRGITLATGLPVGGGKKKTVQTRTESSELRLFLHILLRQPFVRLSVEAEKQDYGLLGERKQMNWTNNFRILAEEFHQHAAGLRNSGFEVLLSGKPISQMGYDSPEAADRELRWLLSLRSAKRA
jgi:hypothetical protein